MKEDSLYVDVSDVVEGHGNGLALSVGCTVESYGGGLATHVHCVTSCLTDLDHDITTGLGAADLLVVDLHCPDLVAVFHVDSHYLSTLDSLAFTVSTRQSFDGRDHTRAGVWYFSGTSHQRELVSLVVVIHSSTSRVLDTSSSGVLNSLELVHSLDRISVLDVFEGLPVQVVMHDC